MANTGGTVIASLVKEYWWMLLLRGLFLLFFGIFLLAWPGVTVEIFLYVMGLYLLAAGVIDIIRSILHHAQQRFWFLVVLLGILEIAVGIYVLQNPGTALATLVLLLGLVFIVRGVFELIDAFGDPQEGASRAVSIVIGILAILAGLVIIRYPIAGGLAFLWVLGVYALVAGPMMIALSFGLKSEAERYLQQSS